MNQKNDVDNFDLNKDNNDDDFDLDYNAKGFKPKNPMPLKNKENRPISSRKKQTSIGYQNKKRKR